MPHRLLSLSAVLLALGVGLSACAGSREGRLRGSVSTAEWLVDAPSARVAAAFEAVRESLGVAPLVGAVPAAMPGPATPLRGRSRGALVTVDLVGEGASTRLHLRMDAASPSAPMEHLRWATGAVVHLGGDVRAVSVPAAIWPTPRTTCVGFSPIVGDAGQGWRAPLLAGGREPAYGGAAKRAGVEGRILLRIAVDRNGAVDCAEVVSGLPHGLSQRAVDAARTWHFQPASRNGARIAATFVTSVVFPIAGSAPMPLSVGPPVCPREDPNCRI